MTGAKASPLHERLHVAWNAPAGQTISGYVVQWKSGTQEYASTRQKAVTSGTAASIAGLTNDTVYTVRVRAYNGTGDGAWSDDAAWQDGSAPDGGGPCCAPQAPTLRAKSVEADSATLELDGYVGDWHYKHTTPGSGSCSATPVTAGAGGLSTASLSNLDEGASYAYKAYSDSSCSSDKELAQAALLTKPGQVTGVALTPYTDQLDVSWTALGNQTVTSYKVQWKSDQEGEKTYDASRQNTATGSSSSITGLVNGRTYTVRVIAYNGTGNGEPSSEATGQPKAVTLTSSNVEAATATLTIAYHVGSWYYKRTVPESGSCSESAVTGTSVNLTGLNGNTNHVYKAYSSSGCASDAELATAPTFLTKPGKPTKPTAEAGSGSGKLTVTASVTGSGTLTKWQYKQKEGTDDFDDDWTDIDSTQTSLSHTLSGLTDSTDYQYKVRARNATGEGAESDASTAARPLDETLSASSVETTTATLTLGNYTGDWYYKYTAPAGGTCAASAVTASTKDLTELAGNTTYTFKAYSDSGCATELASETFLTKPGKPTRPTATPGTGSGKLTLKASITGDSTPAKWQYKEKEGNDWDTDWTDVSNSASTSLSHTLSGLTDGTKYRYKVRAANATGDGIESDESAEATPADEALTASSVEAATATLTLGNYAGNWWLKRTTPADAACKSKGMTYTEDLSSLSSNTSHTYKAYSDSSCTTELTSETFLTKPGKPAKPGASPGAGSGKLTLTASVSGSGTLEKWQYKQKEGTGNFDADWTDVSSTSASLSHVVSGLTDGTDYQYKVRAKNASGFGAESDPSTAAQPLDETLTASAITATGATLTLANWNGSWWLKRTAPADTTCKSKGTTYTEDLSSLSSNSSYTYKAYSNSGCTTELAARTFLTKPGKPAKPTATAGAGSGKLTLTASVSGSGTLTKWQYKQKKGTGDFDNDWTDIQSTSISLSHTITGLTDGTDYQYKVRAANATGDGAESDASTAAQPLDETLTASSVEATTATLTLGNYTGDWWLKRTTPADTTCKSKSTTATEDLTTLSSNTSYTYKAYSNNACTTELATRTFLTKPGKPAKPTATAGSGSGKLTITSSVTGSGALTKWQYKQKEGTSGFDADWTDVSSTSTSLSHTITGLTDGTDYQYKVRAVNATGEGAESDASTAAQPADETLTVSSITATGATLTIGNYTGSWYYKYTAPTGGTCSSSAVTQTSATVSDLDSNTAYTFKAYSDSTCATELATAAAFPTLPPKPAKPTATAGAGSGKLTITSSVTGSSALSKWQYKQKEGTDNYDTDWTDVSSTSTSLSYVVPGLTDGTDYQYKVRAVNASGNGADSDASSPAQPAAVALTASPVEAASATLTLTSWNGSWWLKRTTPADTACKSKSTTTTEDLTSLSSNTNYVYKAYSDSSCATELASETFLTKPGKPTRPTAIAGSGSGQLTLAASISGSGTLTKWQYKQKKDNGSYGSWQDVSSASTTLSHVVSGLTDGARYQFKVRAWNATGAGAESDASKIDATSDPPKGVPKDETLTVSAITATGATLTLDYYAGDWHYKKTTPSSNACSDAVTGLTANTDHVFKAYSDAACNTGLAVSRTFPTLPPKPSRPAATGGAGSSKLTLTSSVTGSAALTKWEYQHRKAADSAWSNWKEVTTTDTSLNYTASGFTDGTAYAFRVRATNASGTGAISDASATDGGKGTPRAITLAASKVEAESATLTLENWTGDWWLKRTTPASTACTSKERTYTEDLSGLDTNASHTYGAYSESGCSTRLAEETFLTKPGKPAKPAATPGAGSGKLTLVSSVTGSGVLVKWQYKQKKGTGAWDDDWTDVASTSASLHHVISGLTDDTDYHYKTRAVNATGESEESDASDASQPGERTLSASDVEATTATLTLGNHTGDWWLKRTTPASAACTSKGAAYTENLQDLPSNTHHAYGAYDASACKVSIAVAVFLTKPGKPTRPSVSNGNGSGKLAVSASVSGQGRLTKWQYKKKAENAAWDARWTDADVTQTTLNHTVENLADGTRYQFKVRAWNATGAGEESEPSILGDDAMPLDEVLSVSAITTEGATLTLSNYAGSWRHKRTTPAGGACSALTFETPDTAVSGLAANTLHAYAAYADAACDTELAVSRTFPTLPPKPAKPEARSGAGSGKLTLTSHIKGGNAALAKWQVRQQEENDDWSEWQDVRQTAFSLVHLAKDLTDGKRYRFRVRAWNASGPGPASDPSDVSEQSRLGIPRDERLTVSGIAADSAVLTLHDYEGNWHWRRLRPAGGACSAKAEQSPETTPGGLQANTVHVFAAYPDAACKTELAASRAFPTLPPKPAKPQTLTDEDPYELTVQASVSGSAPLRHWEITRQKEGKADWEPWEKVEQAGNALDYRAKGFKTLDRTWRFRVRAANASGTGEASDPSDWTTLPPDRSARPVFRDEDGNDLSIPNQHYVQQRPIDPLQLPEASGGDGPLTYRLTPDPPDGLVFDPLARTLSGTPLEALAKTLYAYVARDEDKDETRLTFHITVAANSVPRFLEEARDQDLVQHREIEPYVLPEAEGGDPPLAYALEPALPHGLVLNEDTRTISGTPKVPWEETTYLWTVTDGNGDRARTPFVLTVRQNRVPAFAHGVEDRTWTQDSPVEPLVLPEAEGGDGPLAYALTPALPRGLTLDAKSRTLAGTPAEPSPKTRYTWTASERDEDDPDQVSLAFHLTVKEDLKPHFAGSARVPDQAYVRHQAIRPLQLPRAEGGNPPLAYTLEPPELPRGLVFDAESRTLSGTPAELWEEAVYSYRAQDEDDDRTEPLTFRLRVDHPVPGKPAGLEALPGNMQATLRWLDPGDTTITGYEVRYEGNGRRQDWQTNSGKAAPLRSRTG